MRAPKLILAAAVLSSLAIGSLFGGLLWDGEGVVREPAGASPALAADRVLAGISAAGGTDVRELERAVREGPADVESLVLLGYAYQQRWRETADASTLPRSETALRRALRLEPRDALAVTGLGSLALIRHDFRAALELGRRAQRLAPSSARPFGVVGDALLELGRYEEAFRAFERMVALRPSVASYARIAYARELLGDLSGARAVMQLAADAAYGQREPAAWANVELAKLDLRTGNLSRAERHLRVAQALLPGYVYAAEQLARVEAARGRLPGAIRLARRAAEAVPLPQFVALLADLHEQAGDRPAARRQVATVRAIDRLLAANGVRTDVESAVFDADRRIGTATLVARARAARAARPSILGDDALAWALARTGRCDEARRWSERSLRLGTRDGLLFFHRAEIERCAGDRAAARLWARKALALDPAFSVRWAPVARRLAA
ncbi:MAG TPA: tetratricopeptide repeat protein [Gaiella sp.]|uniref:tetratricopeptide repeat protein n=1 Tax=Gaiella sp. TaxID=2663207 RepID=UPI002D7FEEDD|nr:tetratricopeptide repeat protein [Gaiella sp.]HET9286450.1 tetratricopeptide repeat protein [Gaiella sp.]